MMNNTAYSDNAPTPVDVRRLLAARLPDSWRVNIDQFAISKGPSAILALKAPYGQQATILLASVPRLEPISAVRLVEKMRYWTRQSSLAAPSSTLLVAAPYLSGRTRALLRDERVSYLDSTGNILLAIEDPAVFIQTQGADKDPRRESRPMRSLRGVRTAQILRTLIDNRGPLGVRQIAVLSGADPGNVSRVLSLLESENLIQRTPSGGVARVDWISLLQAWSRDYSVMASNTYSTYLDPRGLPNLLSRLQALPSGVRYAVTGSLAAARLAPVAPPRLGAVYVDDADEVAATLGLIPAESGANIVLLESKGSYVFDGLREDGGIRYVAPSQAAVDLMTGPGRNPAEADALLDWMKRYEGVWRA